MSALFEKAKQQAGRGDHKIALATLRRLMEKERRHAEAPILAANIYEKTGDRDLAADHYMRAAALSAPRKKSSVSAPPRSSWSLTRQSRHWRR